MLLLVARTHHAQEHTIDADGSLNDVRRVALIEFRIEVLDLLSAVLGVLREVKIRTAVNTLYLLESERHEELDIRSCVGIVSQLVVVVETVFLVTQTEGFMPFETELFPMLEPFEFRSRANEELHLHLLELPHTEHELTSYDLVTERLTDLRNTERHFHATGFLYVQEVDEDSLCGLRTKINLHRAVCRRTHLCLEHEVELTHVGPVARTADRTNDLLVENDLFEFIEVIVVHRFGKTLMERLAFGNVLFHTLVGSFEHLLVKTLAETFAGFLYLFGDFVIVFGNLIFDQYVRTVTLLGIAVINQRIIERIYVTGGFPSRRVHKNSRVDTDDVLVQKRHRIPPITLDIVLQLHAVLTVVIYGAQTIVDLAGRKYKSVFLAMRYDFLECFFLCLLCHKAIYDLIIYNVRIIILVKLPAKLLLFFDICK